MERSTIFYGKIHYKWPFSIAMLVITRGYMEFSQLFVDLSGGDLTKMAEEHGQGCPEVVLF